MKRPLHPGPLLGGAALALALTLGACRTPPVEWPAFEEVAVQRGQAGGRHLVLPSAYEAFLRGQLAIEEGDLAGASRSFQAALRSDPHSSYLLAWVARVELDRDDLAAARGAIDRALAVDDCAELALCTAASILVEEGDAEGAMRSLRRAIECEPRQPEAYYQLAALLEREGASGRAEAIYQALVEVHPRQARPHDELARLALARGDTGEAARQLGVLLELEPWRSEVVLQLAQLTFDRGDRVAARALLGPLIARRPRDQGARRLLSEVLLADGDRAAAAGHLDVILPEVDDPGQLAELAELYLRAHRFEAAEGEARRVLALDGSQPLGRRVLVAALRRQGQLERALVEAPQGGALDDGLAVEVALTLWEAGRAEAARSTLRRQLGEHPSSPRSRELQAAWLVLESQDEAAIELLRRGPTVDDQLGLVELLLDLGRGAAATESLAEVALDAEPPPVRARGLSLRARALVEEGGALDEAAELVERAGRLAPHDLEIARLAGEIASARGEQEAAIAALRRVTLRCLGSALGQATLALALARAGRCEEVGPLVEQAHRLRPPGAAARRLEAMVRRALEACGTPQPEAPR